MATEEGITNRQVDVVGLARNLDAGVPGIVEGRVAVGVGAVCAGSVAAVEVTGRCLEQESLLNRNRTMGSPEARGHGECVSVFAAFNIIKWMQPKKRLRTAGSRRGQCSILNQGWLG